MIQPEPGRRHSPSNCWCGCDPADHFESDGFIPHLSIPPELEELNRGWRCNTCLAQWCLDLASALSADPTSPEGDVALQKLGLPPRKRVQ
jgi:hypothetical protein